MGWQDAPVITSESAGPVKAAWMSAPEVDAKPGGLVQSVVDDVSKTPQRVGNLLAGGVRGAGSIGATLTDIARRKLAAPTLDVVPAGMRPSVTAGLAEAPSSREMRGGMDAALRDMGADANSVQYGAGKIGAEVAGTLGAGGALASLFRGAPGLGNAISSGGFVGPQSGNQVMNWLTRVVGGSSNGAVTAGLVNPEQAGLGAVIGGALPPAAKFAGMAGNALSSLMQSGSERLMQSAIKPTIRQLQTGDAATAVKTLLERGINPTKEGVNKLKALIEGLDNQVTQKIAGSNAQIDKHQVLNELNKTRAKYGSQVSPVDDLKAIQNVADEFLAHPLAQGLTIPIQKAQELKRGTYKILEKKYGLPGMGPAGEEAQKAVAKGLKNEIAAAVPEVAPLNAEMGQLITTLKVAERRALMEMNKNPMGLASLAENPATWAMFMADKSALFKSLAARMVNSASGGAGTAMKAIGTTAATPLIRNAAVRAPGND